MGKMLRNEGVALLKGKNFFLGILGICILCWGLAGYYMVLFPGEDLLFYLQMINVDAPMTASFAICAYGYARVYCEEYAQGSMPYIIARSGTKAYAGVRTAVGFLAGAGILFFGKMLFVASASTWYPLILQGGSGVRQFAAEGWGLRELILQGHGWIYFSWLTFVQGLMAGVLCVISQTISLYVMHPAVVIGMPVILNYAAYNYLDSFLKVPGWLSWLRIYDASMPYFDSDGLQLLYSICYSLMIAAALGVLSWRRIKGGLCG